MTSLTIRAPRMPGPAPLLLGAGLVSAALVLLLWPSGSATLAADGDLIPTNGTGPSALSLALVLGAASMIPGLLVMMTAFTRIVIVLGLTRSALGTQTIPPNQVLVGLALFLSLFVMGPAVSQANEKGIQPYLDGKISQSQAVERTVEPFRNFMLAQVREKDLALMVKLAGDDRPASPKDVSTTTLVPAFVVSELREAFLIGFIIFIPFLIIDLVVASVLSGVGMVMLPPAMVSLPFKLLLFVAADGWALIVQSLVESFRPVG